MGNLSLVYLSFFKIPYLKSYNNSIAVDSMFIIFFILEVSFTFYQYCSTPPHHQCLHYEVLFLQVWFGGDSFFKVNI